MEELRDIQGLDAISFWPLAPAWWVIVAILVGCVIAALIYAFKRYRYYRSWQYSSFKILDNLDQQIASNTITSYKTICQQLAIEMRRIAMQSFARETCAGLVGKQWLLWLQKHDPRKFAWESNGKLLVDFQYMPDSGAGDRNNLQLLIAAAKRWVAKC